MTLKEADEAARQKLAVMYQGIVYRRIYETGRRYNENGKHYDFVALLDAKANTVVYAEPDKCQLVPVTRKEE